MCRHLRRAAPALAALSLIAASVPAAAQQRLELPGGFQPDPVPAPYFATGAAEAAEAVRGCPGFVAADPALTLSLTGANALLHFFVVGEGAAGLVAADPDGVHHCGTTDEYGIAHVRFERILSGEYRVWPATGAAGVTVSGTILVSEIELGPRDVAHATGLQIDPALLPPLLSEVPLDPAAEPAFGRFALPADGALELAVTLEGRVPADEAGPGCFGSIDQTRPDVTVTLMGPEPVLAIGAASEVDTTLLVMAPDGAVHCNDDAVNYDPAVVIDEAAPGDYAVWVGVYAGGEGQTASLSVGRQAPEGYVPEPGAAVLDPAAEPAFGRHDLPAAGALELPLVLSGGVSAADAGPGCTGEVDPSRPDAAVNVAAPEPALWFSAAADGADTTLVVSGPDGAVACNDDYDGVNAALAIDNAAPGTYAVWVGSYSGGGGLPATLSVAREAPAGGSAAPEVNPFAGRPLDSAADALAIVLDELGFRDMLTYERLEETGPEGFVLHGVMLRDPTGAEAPVPVGRIRVSDLDLAGLAAYGAPERFALAIEDIAYASLAAEARGDGLPLPLVENAPPLSASLSLLPPGGDAARRELRFGLTFADQLGVSLAARMTWPEGATAMGPMGAAAMVQGEAVEFELHDMGFLGALLRAVAAENGESLEAMIAEGLNELAAELAPLTPGGPRAQLFEAVSAKLGELDRPGVLRASFRSTRPLDTATIMEALVAEAPDPSVIEVEIVYRPDP